MMFNLLLVNFDSQEEIKVCLKHLEENGVRVSEYDEDELWADFDVSGFEPSDFEKYFGNL